MNRNYSHIKRQTADLIAQAKEAEATNQSKEAAELWARVAEGFRTMAGQEARVIDQTRLIAKARQAEARAAKPSTLAPVGGGREVKSEYSGFGNEFIATSTVSWEDIGGMESAKESLIYSMGLQLASKPDYLDIELPSRIVLYGPPGTGKTLLASACANTLNAVFFNVKVSGLLSKYVGESANLISALYQRAREAADSGLAVIFIDEYDSLARSRDKSDSGHNAQVISTLLTELDGLGEKNASSSVITIVATNRPWDLDDAILSRMDLRILVDLPDTTARAEIFKVLLQSRGVKLSNDLSTEMLAEMTENYSGRDIQRFCKKIFLNVLAEQNSSLSNQVKSNSARDYTLRFRSLNLDDATRVLKEMNVKPVSGEDLERYREWS